MYFKLLSIALFIFFASSFSFASKGVQSPSVTLAGKIEIAAFPNPFKEVLHLEITSLGDEPTHVKIYDLIGVERVNISLGSSINNTQKVSIRNIDAGVYFCNVYREEILLGSIKVVCVR